MRVIWTVPEFRDFLTEVGLSPGNDFLAACPGSPTANPLPPPPPAPGETIAAYRRLYFEPHRAVLEGYLSTHVPGGLAALESKVRAMDLVFYRDALVRADRGPLRSLVTEALRSAERALPMPAGPGGHPEAHFIFGFLTMDAGVTLAGARPVIVAALEFLARHPSPDILVKHEYGHLFRLSEPAHLAVLTEMAAAGGLAAASIPLSEALVSEGLATLTPAYVDGRLEEAAENPDYLAELLFFAPDQLARARELEAELWREFLPGSEGGDRALLSKLFWGSGQPFNDDGLPSRTGYYLGARLGLALLSRRGSAAFPDLLTSPAPELLREGCGIMGLSP
ncbi:MAG: hypothetical protein AB1645_08835 [Bacillota bacterium]